jgi:Rps23 Pro-64 3,4-dihydroxylase Tpa1-like proline 4-hydroxylase
MSVDDPAAEKAAAEGREEKSPNPKRTKTASVFDNLQILSGDLLDRKDSILRDYKDAKPFPYKQIHSVFQPNFLLKCKEEIKSQTKVNFKESDLFRVYQSIDFANLDPERASTMNLDTSKLQTVQQLRDVLYSQEWRSFVEGCAGLPPGTLIDKIDCACNCHSPGCHLLCHDDVIGTRKISYIIYLTEENWDGPTEGGALELYGPQTDDNSAPIPLAKAWPIFNSMAFFEVLPGRSFHAVQEVTGDRPRLSLQGWYHAKDPLPEEEMEKATLQQLKAITNYNDDETKLPPTTGANDSDDTFADADKNYLKDYIQPVYLTEESMNEIQKKFEDNSTIQFRNFLLQKWVPVIPSNPPREDTKEEESTDDHYRNGTSSEWIIRGPAHKQRYLTYTKNENNQDNTEPIGELLYTVRKKIFESEAFLRYLKRVTSLDKPTAFQTGDTIRRFRPGLDYTVAHYGLLKETSVLDATMCFVRDTTEYDQAMWEGGDMGGFECYIEADEEDLHDEHAMDGEDIDAAAAASGTKGAPMNTTKKTIRPY